MMKLVDLFKKRGVYFGAAILPNLLEKEPEYAKILSSEFDMVASESCMKWSAIHPNLNEYTFDEADKLVGFALENKMAIRGHTLVYSRKMPDWFNNIKDKNVMEKQLEEHIKTIVERYKGKVCAWDVINEEIDFNGNHQQSPLFKILGTTHIEKAFQWAHEADHKAKLFVNEFGIEEMGSRSDLIYEMIVGFLEKGVPVHGIGFQMHRALGNDDKFLNKLPNLESMRKNFQRFADLGLEIHITEMDIPIQKGSGTYQERLAEQAKAYREILEVALSIKNFKALVIWGITDLQNWIDYMTKEKDAPLLFDREYKKKPAYFRMMEAFENTK